MSGFSYKKAGVDIKEGERLVDRIKPLVKQTFRKGVMTDIGSFGALFRLDTEKYSNPVLVSGTDGVGTKLKVAFLADVHNTVGIDLVAMCVNDVLTCGAEPLFFLDYFATGKLSAESATEVVAGIAEGCKDAGCALIGGETAEMPGFYAEGEYDLSGFCVGVVQEGEIVDGSTVGEGDVLIGLLSNGLHSNGYSLVRKVFLEHKGLDINAEVPELGSTLAAELLRPTRIYVRAVRALQENSIKIKAMAHITGGGLSSNVPRALPDGYRAAISRSAWPAQPVFSLLKSMGDVSDKDMYDTFNMGIGYVMAVAMDDAGQVADLLRKNGYHSCIIGKVEKGEQGVALLD